MKRLRISYKVLKTLTFSILFTLFTTSIFSNDVFEINGNEYTDTEAIISLLQDLPKNLNKDYSNDIIKTLNASNLFSDVSIEFNDNKYNLYIFFYYH